MKKIFLILFLLFGASLAYSQPKISDLFGTWKIVVKNSALKVQPPAEYLLLMDDSIYAWGVDSVQDPLPGITTGRWIITADGELELTPSDRYMDRRYYKLSDKNRYQFVATKKGKIRKLVQVPEMDIYLEKD
jgi:hypothetical protein